MGGWWNYGRIIEPNRLAGFIRWILGINREEAFKDRDTDFHIYSTLLQTKPYFSEMISSPSIQSSLMSDLTLKRKEAGLDKLHGGMINILQY